MNRTSARVHDMQVSPVFYVVDYDRCLGNAERLYLLLQDSVMAVSSNFDCAAMNAERDTVESKGGSFDELRYVDKQLGDTAQYQAALRTFIARGQSQPPSALLEDGALAFIDYLSARHPFGILTFGSPAWQAAKLQASLPRSLPHIIMGHKHKIRYMKQWRDPQTGLFVLPDEFRRATGYSHAAQLVLVDDKAAAFADIEDDMRGYWILHRQPLPSQKGDIDERVTKVVSFQQVIDHEATIDKT
jgi:hypothetical protein